MTPPDAPDNSQNLAESERRALQETFFNLESEKDIAEERYRNLFQYALVGLFRLRLEDGTLLDINQEALRIFGYESKQEYMRQIQKDSGFFPFLHREDSQKKLLSGVPSSYTFQTEKRDGSPLWAEITVKYIKETDYVEGAVKDITDLMVAHQKLKESMESEKAAREEALQASDAKSQFLANVSHEIRTPLNSILGYSEILTNTNDWKSSRIYAKEILQESEKLMILINQLLDLSKIEAEKIKLDKSHFHLEKLLDESLRPLMLSIQKKDLDMIQNIHKDVPVNLFGDPFRLRQILINLLSNAVKFTDSGNIRLSVEFEGHKDHLTCLLFSISDSGIGIPPDKLSTITESFEQAAPSTEREFGGTGLGLSIASRLIELMGGKLFVKSELNEGSTFSFTCFFETMDHSKEENKPLDTMFTPEIAGNLTGSRILVCEDYATNQQIVYHHLTNAECDVTIVNNGKEAWDLMKDENFDLILMDLQMPVMGGLEATRNIRRIEGQNLIPIIGMTAAAFQKDRDKCFEAGMNDFIAKPIRRSVLINKVKKWLLHDNSETPAEEEQESEVDGFPFQAFLNEMDGDIKKVQSIIKNFINSVMETIPQLEKAISARDWEDLAHSFHTIKGAALNIHAQRLADCSQEMELAAKEQKKSKLVEKYPLFLDEFHLLNNQYHQHFP